MSDLRNAFEIVQEVKALARRDGVSPERWRWVRDMLLQHRERFASLERAYCDGAELPPVVVSSDGQQWQLIDGFHRLHLSRRKGAHGILAIDASRKGSEPFNLPLTALAHETTAYFERLFVGGFSPTAKADSLW